ncbi:hypothetical protein BU24DRAFT_419987 [Aaosphaeria arxii CBS 175.79]|uniref:F-box domain-containing protein n=1 Tax=Aaosphaeria arxii CBS 175.79 TaxID=1450172 RepID=A0A6A5XVT2_9PLEO|nr:uncharacterized protein BU24DRAFT_419987 [Aaosphaeria arxii CBS 175.79]KAF2016937.1 hypothetical protein BU24DRAFT_419987 [Aaosphaeria arxii CBS 175.79]
MAVDVQRGLVSRIGRKLKLNKAPKQSNDPQPKPQKLQKRISRESGGRQEGVNELGERECSIFSDATTLVGSRDHTEMFHGLAHHGSFDSLVEGARDGYRSSVDTAVDEKDVLRMKQISKRYQEVLRKLPADVWDRIASFLDPLDTARLVMSSPVLLEKLGHEPLRRLSLSQNHHHRVRLLNDMDGDMPGHLLCFPCGKYHAREKWGEESLKADFVNNPLYNCPNVRASVLPRMRLTGDRELPYSFIQLATRHARHSDDHGIAARSLERRWRSKCTGWSHQTRYMVHDGRLLMRIRSQVFADAKLTPTAERMLLYDREEYTPFFSVCAHWMDGELMRICKCALSHIPAQRESLRTTIKKPHELKEWIHKPSMMPRLCDECRPARRCPECPTEYLIELRLEEDKRDPVNRFKHALIVTRWSDLGDGSSPTASPEYCAVTGTKADYDSFQSVGRRAVGGIFESHMTGSIPGQRLISLNPEMQKLGEAGHGWY